MTIKKENLQALAFIVMLALLFLMQMLVACQEERPADNIQFSVEVNKCVEGYYLIAVVDEGDKFEKYFDINCSKASGNGRLSVGDLLELRCYRDGGVDTTLRYNYRVRFGNVDTTFVNKKYTGVNLILK